MALVNSVTIGLTALSDLGIGLCIIQDEKGGEPEFLNTAWTIRVLRGIVLWVCACLSAFLLPTFYGEPSLRWAIPIMGLGLVMGGFNSTALYTYHRELRFGKPIAITLISQVVASLVMLGWGWFSPSLWSLGGGGVASALTTLLLSHGWMDGIRNKFCWNREVVKHLLRFGRWILVISVIGVVFTYADKLVTGKFMALEDLKVYSLAIALATVLGLRLNSFVSPVNQLLLPLYVHLRELPLAQFQTRVRRIRTVLMAIVLILLLMVSIYSEDLGLFLASRESPYYSYLLPLRSYFDAGLIQVLQILVLMNAIAVATQFGPIFVALGDSFLAMKLTAIEKSLMLTCMVVGGWQFGMWGLIWGRVIATILYYPFVANAYYRYSLWFPKLDLAFMTSVVAVAGLGWALRHFFLASFL